METSGVYSTLVCAVHTLGPAYLLLYSRWSPSTEEIILRLKVPPPALQSSSCPGLVLLLKMVVIDDPRINTELMLLRLVTLR